MSEKDVYAGFAGAERRRFPRHALKLRIQYQQVDKDTVTPVQRQLARDLGVGGLAMETDRDLAPDQLLMITLYLPSADQRAMLEAGAEAPAETGRRVNVLSRVAWTAPGRAGNRRVGIQFLDLPREDRMVMKQFLKDYRLYKPDASLNL